MVKYYLTNILHLWTHTFSAFIDNLLFNFSATIIHETKMNIYMIATDEHEVPVYLLKDNTKYYSHRTKKSKNLKV